MGLFGTDPFPNPDAISAPRPSARRLDPRARNVRLLVHLIQAPILAGLAWGLERKLYEVWQEPWLPRGSLFAVLLALVAIRTGVDPFLWYRAWSWHLRPGDLLMRRGWLWRHEQAVPLDRVQHVDVHAGPLDRAFGLAEVKVFTAGSGAADVTIPGLAREDAERLRDLLLDTPPADAEAVPVPASKSDGSDPPAL